MDSDVRTASSVEIGGGLSERAAGWLFLKGDRRVVVVGTVLVVGGGFGGFVAAGVLAVGPASSVAGVFGSGLTAGVVTLLTIALSGLLVHSGLVALLASVPLALFAAYIHRAATIAHRTVPVGPFVPPSER